MSTTINPYVAEFNRLLVEAAQTGYSFSLRNGAKFVTSEDWRDWRDSFVISLATKGFQGKAEQVRDLGYAEVINPAYVVDNVYCANRLVEIVTDFADYIDGAAAVLIKEA